MSQNRKGFKMKKLKFLLATLVFLALVLVCGQVKATDAPTRIYNKYDLYDFIVAYGGDGSAKIDGNKVILNKSITASTDMYFPGASEKCEDIYLDLNGNYIYFNITGDKAVWWNSSERTLTITGKADSNSDYIRTTNGKALYTGTNKNITIENIDLISDSSTVPTFEGYGTSITNMKNVTLKSNFGCALAGAGVTVNLENVTFNLGNPTCQYGVKIYGTNGVANLKNCKYESSQGKGQVVWITANTAKATIDGGTYKYTGDSSNYLILNENGTLEIKDGTFTNQYGTALRVMDESTTTISGGAFDGREKTITTAGSAVLILKGGSITARTQYAGQQGAAIGFSMSKTMDDIIADGYFATNTETRTNSGFRLTGPEVCVYAKPNSITFDKTEFTYNGKDQAPTVIVKDTEGKTLQYDTDYIVQYPTNRKDVGEYKATVKFIDRYETMPSKELSYKINKATYDMSKFKFENKKVTYNGKNQSITATGIPEGLKVTYLNNDKKKVGEYKVTAHFEVDTKNYNPVSDKTATLTIVPKGTSISKLKAGKKQFKATWKKQKTQTTGYEIQYSTNSKFKSGNKKVKIKKNKTTSTTVKKLKGKKKYYVRIRTYKTVNGKKICSEWSKSKKVTTKK